MTFTVWANLFFWGGGGGGGGSGEIKVYGYILGGERKGGKSEFWKKKQKLS